MLDKVFNFLAEARQDRMKRYADYYAKESIKKDKMSNEQLLKCVDHEAMIAINDVERAMNSLKHRGIFRLSPYDIEEHITPVYNRLMTAIERGDVPCYVNPTENVFESGIIRTSDIVAVLDSFYPAELDDRTTVYGVQDVPVPIDPDFGDSPIGKLRQKFYDAFPLRTASTPVRYEQQEEEREVDVRRMFILAIGFAGTHNSKTLENIPLFSETKAERDTVRQNQNRVRKYRGRDY